MKFYNSFNTKSRTILTLKKSVQAPKLGAQTCGRAPNLGAYTCGWEPNLGAWPQVQAPNLGAWP